MQDLVNLSKIFSDINRVKMIALIIRDKEVCVCEICDTLELLQPLVSRYLKQMKEANVLVSKKKGKWINYSLTQNRSVLLNSFILEIKKEIFKLPKLIVCNKKQD